MIAKKNYCCSCCGTAIYKGEKLTVESGFNKEGNFNWIFVQCSKCLSLKKEQ